jgi:hypothetical protein
MPARKIEASQINDQTGNQMKGTRQMKAQTKLARLLPALALAAIFSLGAATSTQGGPQPHLRSGMFGVARGQVARINAVNLGGPDTRPIQVEMVFLDGTAAVVGRDLKTIARGQAAFFDVIFDAGEANRIELRAVISGVQPPEPDKNLKVTVEVFDADTGRNTVFIGEPGL